MLAEPELIVVQPETPAPPYDRAEAAWLRGEAQHVSPPDISMRGDSPSRDSSSSNTAVDSDRNDSPVSSQTLLDQPLTVVPCTDVASPATAPTRSTLYRSPNAPQWFLQTRYQQRHHVLSEPNIASMAIKTVPALNAFPSRPKMLGRGWEPLVHPEGQVYFRRKDHYTFYTNTYLYDDGKLQDLEEAVDVLDEQLRERGVRAGCDVGLDVRVDEDDDKLACYYIADTTKEEVFWLDDMLLGDHIVLCNVPIVDVDSLKHALEHTYWIHILMFPHGRQFSAQRLKEIGSMLNCYLFDRVTSRTSCAPWDETELHRLHQVVKEIDIDEGGTVSAWDMFPIARLHMMIAIERLEHFWGTKWARLDSNRSAQRDIKASDFALPWFFTAISWALFCTPTLYMKRLDEIWLDKNVNYRLWRRFIDEIQEDWAASITPSAVILSANVGFLAIQSVDQGGYPFPGRSAGQIVSYLSTLLSIGNIVACTILGRQHRPTSHLHAEDACSYLMKRAVNRWKTARLAIILSIPTAFFIWALLSFTAAILWLSLNATSVVTRVLAVACTLFIVGLVVLVITNGDWTAPEMAQALPATVKRNLRKIRAPVRRLTAQTRKYSEPLRAWSEKMRRFTAPPEGDSEHGSYGSPVRSLSAGMRRSSVPVRRLTEMMYGFRRTTEPEEMV